MKRKNLLFIDDLRMPPTSDGYKAFYIYIARTYKDAIDLLNKEHFDLISFDHDLGEEKTGYDIAKYMVENNIRAERFMIHSANSVRKI